MMTMMLRSPLLVLALLAVLAATVSAAPQTPASATTTGNLQTWKKQVNGVAAPAVKRDLSKPLPYRVQATDANTGATKVDEAFRELQSALRRSCDAFLGLCLEAAKLTNNADTASGNCRTGHTSCVASIPNSLNQEPPKPKPAPVPTGTRAIVATSAKGKSTTTTTVAAGRGKATPTPVKRVTTTTAAGKSRATPITTSVRGGNGGAASKSVSSTRGASSSTSSSAAAKPTTAPGQGADLTTPPATGTGGKKQTDPATGAGNNLDTPATGTGAGATGKNVQTFTGALFGKPAPPVNFVSGARPFEVRVNGQLNGDFLNAAAALGRSCDVQKNQCADEVNRQRAGRSASVGQCDQQNAQCKAAIPAGEAAAAKLQAGNGNNLGGGNAGGNTGNGNNAGNGNNNAGNGNNNAGNGNNNAGNGGNKNGQTGLVNGADFCKQVGLGNALADGTQKRTSTCSGTVQGAIPDFNNMVSTVIFTPENGAKLPRNTAVNFSVRTSNLDAGFFEDPNARYYASPQTLNARGQIEGHQHVTVQRLGNAQTPPDPRTESLAFFKGLDQEEDANGVLTTTIPPDALATPGLYRICTMTGTRGHQPVLMPVARRGAQDDCIRVTVV
ncbi:hypothetical protein H9P43_006371 [Blastocladiella emersonii ATCC 22665]|nr:hypothetical protein H9P43_006371 [Blastocladiella emersonii ATCC 22665]